MGRLFGTDGARGVAVTELTCELAMNIGRAAAMVLALHSGSGKPCILIGKDTRISSDTLEAALVAGITSVGANVMLTGVLPTPAIAFLVKKCGANAGIMISASHNPVQDNGIKLFGGDGFKLPDETEEEIEALILDTPEKILLKSGAEIGKVEYLSDGAESYAEHITGTAGCKFNGIKVLIDCSNGSAYKTASMIFTSLGADCSFFADKPNGCNINDNCGSTHMDNLCGKVCEGGYDLGIAFDGDADRCLAVDEKGRIIDGDKIIAVISKQMKADGLLKKDTAVVTVMSNLGFHDFMKNNGINTVSVSVGDRYVLREMLENGYSIGGEQSGHIIFLDYAATGDGQLTAVQLIKLMKTANKPLSELVEGINDYPQKLVGIRVNDELKNNWQKNTEISDMIKQAEASFGDKGRVLVRASGTEPLIRVMIEGENPQEVELWTEKIAQTVRNAL